MRRANGIALVFAVVALPTFLACGAADSGDSQGLPAASDLQGVQQQLVETDPSLDPCAAVRCKAGTHCEASSGVAECLDDVFCGGIAGMACPGFGQCADDPSDDCDPAQGGADCGGVCQCVQTALCIQGLVFDSSPEVCACVAAENPCNLADCQPNTQCVVRDNEAVCVPQGRPHPRHPHHRPRRHHRH